MKEKEKKTSPSLQDNGDTENDSGSQCGFRLEPVLFLDVVGRYFDENFLRTGNMALSAAIKAAGFETRLLTVKEDDDPESTIKAVKHIRPRIIMVSLFTILLFATSKVLHNLRKKVDTLVIAGGHHPTSDPRGALSLEGVDLVCVGEGDLVLPRLLEHLSTYDDRKSFLNALPFIKDLPGIWYLDKNGEAVDRGPAPRAEILDELPPWDRELYPTPFIEDNSLFKMGSIVPVYSGRGCPYSCHYCANSGLQDLYGKEGHVRQRSVDNLVEELVHLKSETGAEIFFFCDEQFLQSRSWVLKFADLYRKEVNLPYVVMTSPQTIDEESSRILLESGCSFVNMGLESGHETFRRQVLGKKFSNKRFLDAIGCLKKYGIMVCINVMIRLPEETIQHARATLDMLARAEADQVEVCIYNPFPGTRLAGLADEKGLLEEINGPELRAECKHQQTVKERRILRVGEDRFLRVRLSQMTESEYQWYSDAVEALFWSVDMRFAWNHRSTQKPFKKSGKSLLWAGRGPASERIAQSIKELKVHRFNEAPEGKSISSNPNVLSLFFHELERLNPAAVYFDVPEDSVLLSGPVTSGGRMVFTPPPTELHQCHTAEFLSHVGILDPELFSAELLTWISHVMKIHRSNRHERAIRGDIRQTRKPGVKCKVETHSDVQIRSAGQDCLVTAALITAHLTRILNKPDKFRISPTPYGFIFDTGSGEHGTIRWICIMEDGPPRITAWAQTQNLRKHDSLNRSREQNSNASVTLWSRGPHHEIVLAKHENKVKKLERHGTGSYELAARALTSFVGRGKVDYIDGRDMALANTLLAELRNPVAKTECKNTYPSSGRLWRWPSSFAEHIPSEALVDMDPVTGNEIVFVDSLNSEPSNNAKAQLFHGSTGETVDLPAHPAFGKWEREGGPFHKAFAEKKSTPSGSDSTKEIMEWAEDFLNAWKNLLKKIT